MSGLRVSGPQTVPVEVGGVELVNRAVPFFGQEKIHGPNDIAARRFQTGVIVVPERLGGSSCPMQGA